MRNELQNNENKGYMNIFDEFNNIFSGALNKEMKTNIEDTADSYIVTSYLAGVSKENVSINVEDSTLTISVKKEAEDTNKNYLIKERSSCDMSRSFYLEDIDHDSISAKLTDGVLTILCKKIKKENNTKTIEVL